MAELEMCDLNPDENCFLIQVTWLLNTGMLGHICSCCSASVLSKSCQVKMLIPLGLYCMDLQYTSGEIVFIYYFLVSQSR